MSITVDTTIVPLLELLARFPRLAGLFGLVVAIAFGYLGIASWTALQEMPDAPPKVSLAQAVSLVSSGAEAWVDLDRVTWGCENIVHGDADRTEVIFTDEVGSILGVALFSGSDHLCCAELADTHLTGILTQMGDGFLQRMPARGFDLARYDGVVARLHLCSFCGRGNSTGLVIISAVMVLVGLSLYPLCLFLRKRYMEKGSM